jgi:hypothetical protein
VTTTEIKVGRRIQDGTVELSMFMPQLLTLRVSYGGERAASVQLTREQVWELRRALDEFELQMAQEQEQAKPWDGGERRRPAA